MRKKATSVGIKEGKVNYREKRMTKSANPKYTRAQLINAITIDLIDDPQLTAVGVAAKYELKKRTAQRKLYEAKQVRINAIGEEFKRLARKDLLLVSLTLRSLIRYFILRK